MTTETTTYAITAQQMEWGRKLFSRFAHSEHTGADDRRANLRYLHEFAERHGIVEIYEVTAPMMERKTPSGWTVRAPSKEECASIYEVARDAQKRFVRSDVLPLLGKRLRRVASEIDTYIEHFVNEPNEREAALLDKVKQAQALLDEALKEARS